MDRQKMEANMGRVDMSQAHSNVSSADCRPTERLTWGSDQEWCRPLCVTGNENEGYCRPVRDKNSRPRKEETKCTRRDHSHEREETEKPISHQIGQEWHSSSEPSEQ